MEREREGSEGEQEDVKVAGIVMRRKICLICPFHVGIWEGIYPGF